VNALYAGKAAEAELDVAARRAQPISWGCGGCRKRQLQWYKDGGLSRKIGMIWDILDDLG